MGFNPSQSKNLVKMDLDAGDDDDDDDIHTIPTLNMICHTIHGQSQQGLY